MDRTKAMGYLEQLNRFMEMEGNEQRESKAAAHNPATQTRTCIILILLFS